MGFAPSSMPLTSTAFSARGAIPAKHTGEGADVSPALAWSGAPEGTQSFAIVCHDPDAPLVKPTGAYGYTHWVLYNIPGNVTSLDEGTTVGTTGANDWGRSQWNGPMPPPGHGVHHYYFWVLALDANLNLEPGLGLNDFLAKVEPNLLGMNRLIGTYERK